MPTSKKSPGTGQVSRASKFAQGTSSQSVSFLNLPTNLLVECVEAVTLAGDAIAFTRTSDLGAVSVTLLSDGLPGKRYCDTDYALTEALQRLQELFDCERGT